MDRQHSLVDHHSSPEATIGLFRSLFRGHEEFDGEGNLEVDLLCANARLAIELDGVQHGTFEETTNLAHDGQFGIVDTRSRFQYARMLLRNPETPSTLWLNSVTLLFLNSVS